MCISCFLPFLSFLLKNRVVTKEKLSVYECGFEPFGKGHIPFTIHFYLVAILFLIFDLEVVLLFPWCFVISTMVPQFFYLMLYFFLILGIGYIYEWRRGALEW
jgi:NADH-quinone oxidoreductase subunit A